MKLEELQKARDIQNAIISSRLGKKIRLKDLQRMRRVTESLISNLLFGVGI